MGKPRDRALELKLRDIYEKLIEAVYRQWNAEKVGDVPRLMEKYKGQEAEIYDKIVRKYVFSLSKREWLRLIEIMYRRFNPLKLTDLDPILEKYSNSEAALYRALCDKYLGGLQVGDEPPQLDAWRGEAPRSLRVLPQSRTDEELPALPEPPTRNAAETRTDERGQEAEKESQEEEKEEKNEASDEAAKPAAAHQPSAASTGAVVSASEQGSSSAHGAPTSRPLLQVKEEEREPSEEPQEQAPPGKKHKRRRRRNRDIAADQGEDTGAGTGSQGAELPVPPPLPPAEAPPELVRSGRRKSTQEPQKLQELQELPELEERGQHSARKATRGGSPEASGEAPARKAPRPAMGEELAAARSLQLRAKAAPRRGQAAQDRYLGEDSGELDTREFGTEALHTPPPPVALGRVSADRQAPLEQRERRAQADSTAQRKIARRELQEIGLRNGTRHARQDALDATDRHARKPKPPPAPEVAEEAAPTVCRKRRRQDVPGGRDAGRERRRRPQLQDARIEQPGVQGGLYAEEDADGDKDPRNGEHVPDLPVPPLPLRKRGRHGPGLVAAPGAQACGGSSAGRPLDIKQQPGEKKERGGSEPRPTELEAAAAGEDGGIEAQRLEPGQTKGRAERARRRDARQVAARPEPPPQAAAPHPVAPPDGEERRAGIPAEPAPPPPDRLEPAAEEVAREEAAQQRSAHEALLRAKLLHARRMRADVMSKAGALPAGAEGFGQSPAQSMPIEFSWASAAPVAGPGSREPPASGAATAPPPAKPPDAARGISGSPSSSCSADSLEDPNRRMVTLRGNLEARLRARALNLLTTTGGPASAPAEAETGGAPAAAPEEAA